MSTTKNRPTRGIVSTCCQCGKSFHSFPSRLRNRLDKYCSMTCFGIARRRKHADDSWPNAGVLLDETLPARFWAKVDKSDPDGCWIWIGSTSGAGYGRFHVNRRGVLAHRVAYALVHGTAPAGIMLCHRCDNPKCVRPDHLFPGTQKDNMRDCSLKKRSNRAGEHNGKSKLNWQAVADIRRRCQGDKAGMQALADEYSVAVDTIRRVIKGCAWTPQTEPATMVAGKQENRD